MGLLKSIVVFVMVGVLSLTLTAGAAAAPGTSNAPVRLDFDKTAVAPGMWEGTVSGDFEGDLTTVLTSLRVAGPIWHVTFDWIIDADDPDYSFIASLSGTLNPKTGKVVMNGTVVDGYLLGAQVHEEGQLVDADTLQFQGAIRIMPATAH
jgi:hypothetical protein